MKSALQSPPGTDGLPTLSSGRWGLEAIVWLLTAAWTAGGLLMWLMFPMTATVLLPMCMIAPLAGWYWTTQRRLHVPSAVTLALLLVGVYLLINAFWSLSPWSAVKAVVLVFMMAGVLHVVPSALSELDAPLLRAMAVGMLAGLTLSCVLLGFEIFSEQALRRLLMNIVPALQPYPQHVEMAAGRVTRLMPYLPNASISVLSMMFWPALLVAGRLGWLHRHRWPVLIASAVAAVSVFASEHATSQVAFAGAAVAFALFLARPLLARRLAIAGWVAATLLVVPLAALPYSFDLHRASWLPESARHRLVIWRYTSEQVTNAPILGAGIAAARAMNESRDLDGPVVPGTKFQLGTSLHSHNAYLQVWYETGAVGALMLLGLGVLILRALTGRPEAIRPYLAATFVACALAAASSYSIWAPWYMASIAMVCIFAALGATLPADADGTVAAPAPGTG